MKLTIYRGSKEIGGTCIELQLATSKHPHQDHYRLLSFVNPEIPVYMSIGCKELIEVSYYFGQTDYDFKNIVTIKAWQPFKSAMSYILLPLDEIVDYK